MNPSQCDRLARVPPPVRQSSPVCCSQRGHGSPSTFLQLTEDIDCLQPEATPCPALSRSPTSLHTSRSPWWLLPVV
eukprot:scaffold48_cov395-Prasinococcus_capsulatus_cf.AAC.32